MTDYKPGTVAKATVRGVPETVLRVSGLTGKPGWRAAGGWFRDYEVTDVHPLVVLDLAYPKGMVESLRHAAENDICVAAPLTNLADQIEAQTRPTIEEPHGLGAVVEDEDGTKWVRADDDGEAWHGFGAAREPYWRRWADLEVRHVLSEGVQP